MSKPPAKSPAQLAAGFIAESLDDLAELATRHGHYALADTLIQAAGQALRAAQGGPSATH